MCCRMCFLIVDQEGRIMAKEVCSMNRLSTIFAEMLRFVGTGVRYIFAMDAWVCENVESGMPAP
jgi:hypothetical protein